MISDGGEGELLMLQQRKHVILLRRLELQKMRAQHVQRAQRESQIGTYYARKQMDKAAEEAKRCEKEAKERPTFLRATQSEPVRLPSLAGLDRSQKGVQLSSRRLSTLPNVERNVGGGVVTRQSLASRKSYESHRQDMDEPLLPLHTLVKRLPHVYAAINTAYEQAVTEAADASPFGPPAAGVDFPRGDDLDRVVGACLEAMPPVMPGTGRARLIAMHESCKAVRPHAAVHLFMRMMRWMGDTR